MATSKKTKQEVKEAIVVETDMQNASWEMVRDLEKEYQAFRAKVVMGKEKNTNNLRVMRRKIAKVHTLINQKKEQ